VVAVRRERRAVGKARQDPNAAAEVEIALYVTSRRLEDGPLEALAQAIRRHWGAIENGSHHRRDVTLGEDASRIRHRAAAQAMAAIRNLALGLYELNVARHDLEKETLSGVGEAKLGFASWRRRLKNGDAIRLICR
jgi:predicted transposase YbfD/YdcC